MLLTDWAMAGLGVVMAVGSSARRGFDHLSRKGRAVRPGDGSLAGIVERVVTRDVPSAIGHALGVAADGLVRGVEFTRHTTAAVPRQVESAVRNLVRGVGLPSAGEIRALRERLDAVATRIDLLCGQSDEEPATPQPRRGRPKATRPRTPGNTRTKAARKR